jgi:hypothetical protein
MLTMNGQRPRFVGTVTIESIDAQGDARCRCSCGAQWIRPKVRHKHAATYSCMDCGADSPFSLAFTGQPRPASPAPKQS